MTPIDERIAEALHAAVPHPPRELDPPLIRARTARRTPPLRRFAPALAAAAVIAVAVGVFLAVRSPGPTSHDHRVSPPPPAAPNRASPLAITERTVERLLAAAPIVPGATRVDRAPVPILRDPAEALGSDHLVARHAWWTTSRSEQDVLDYAASHVAIGLKQNGSFSGEGVGDARDQGLRFEATGREWGKPAVFTELELLINAVPYRDGTAIRVDAEAIWLPPRASAGYVPLAVKSVDIVVDRNGSAPTVRRTLDMADARSLARLVNGLPVATPGTFHCPMMRGFSDTLTFHSVREVVTVHAEADGCGFVHLVPAPENAPDLSGGVTLNRAVLRLLGLPPDYGW
jgi:hypothetical protein